jgi:3-hydroxyacyl-[acyl-carrier-protein] dehydratase
MSPASFSIAATHPALAGHFPGNPVVPGVVILNAVIQAAEAHSGLPVDGIRKSKFVQILRAEEEVTIEFGAIKDQRLRFKCLKGRDGSLLGEGNLILGHRAQ